ncbi:unnamed protein product [marine sediment metagenome]|uniref:Uncharacterized protein n=1 Tax=marine sediment metagenome TaxID=412755 RepID=X1R513_9ZZZZ
MALNEAECKQCQVELDKMKALPAELRWLPEAQARMAKLESALDSECSSSGSAAAGVAVVVGLSVLGLSILGALLGSRQ